jgi:hypothetical protein
MLWQGAEQFPNVIAACQMTTLHLETPSTRDVRILPGNGEDSTMVGGGSSRLKMFFDKSLRNC